MNEWQERVVLEKQNLDQKIEALQRWLKNPPVPGASNIEVIDLQLLEAQLMSMKTYSGVLGMRIAHFK